jgi:periplasmic divalent cation tolerance protein
VTEGNRPAPQASEALVVLTTTETEDEARIIAKTLAEQKLAACVQIVGPIRSVYRWKGSVESAQEWLCIVKTTRAVLCRVEDTVRAVHSYDVPEFVAVPVVGGSADYLAWLFDQVRG